MSVATRAIDSRGVAATAVLLDGFAVYVQERAQRWEREHSYSTIEAEAPFVDAICAEYAALARRCTHLVVVDHISPDPPSPAEYALDPARWRLREVVTCCRAGADHVIPHDRADVTHTDVSFVEGIAKLLIAG